MAVKVLRVMEYTYPDAITMSNDIQAWVVPARGIRRFGDDETVRSTILEPDFQAADEDEEVN